MIWIRYLIFLLLEFYLATSAIDEKSEDSQALIVVSKVRQGKALRKKKKSILSLTYTVKWRKSRMAFLMSFSHLIINFYSQESML